MDKGGESDETSGVTGVRVVDARKSPSTDKSGGASDRPSAVERTVDKRGITGDGGPEVKDKNGNSSDIPPDEVDDGVVSEGRNKIFRLEGAIYSIVKTTQNKLISSVNEPNKILKNFNKRFDDLSIEITKISNENSILKTNVSKLENKLLEIENISSLSSQISEFNITNELADRQPRAQNIILYNLSEDSNNTQNSTSDGDRLKLIFNEMKIDFNPINFNRLGKLSNRTRPLKITFMDTKNIFKILRGQSKLRHFPDFKDLPFSSDKTLKQREHMQTLRKELQSRRENGEIDIIIKYIKGNSQIINSKNL
ncbi:hypothetical protein QTP88_020217 [Uroleucon formosanum]